VTDSTKGPVMLTGGAGFVGVWITEVLVNEGYA
jgi:nucleoside-diphosphate-sugar epimerase